MFVYYGIFLSCFLLAFPCQFIGNVLVLSFRDICYIIYFGKDIANTQIKFHMCCIAYNVCFYYNRNLDDIGLCRDTMTKIPLRLHDSHPPQKKIFHSLPKTFRDTSFNTINVLPSIRDEYQYNDTCFHVPTSGQHIKK